MKEWIATLLLAAGLQAGTLSGQCNNDYQFPADPVTASTFNDTMLVTDEQLAGQFYVIEGLSLDETYVFLCSGGGTYLTIRDVYNPATVITHGAPPLTWTVPPGGPDLVAVHVNLLSPPCGVEATGDPPRTTQVVCTSCPGLPPSVGIGIPAPEAVLDVSGEIRVGNVQSPPKAGMIRWNPGSQDFEGYNGIRWMSLTMAPAAWGEIPTIVGKETIRAVAADGQSFDYFGEAVSISGDYAVIGSGADDIGTNANQGSAYLLKRLGSIWLQEAKLTASDGEADDYFGSSVAISGDYVIVGARNDDVGANQGQGSVYVFKRSGTSWSEVAKLTASDGATNDWFGASVSISGDYFIAGAPYDDIGPYSNHGSAYVFKRNGTSWSQEAKLTSSDGISEDRFGASVSISGEYAIMGASLHNVGSNTDQGSAYIFKRTGTNWLQEAKLTASDGAPSDWFGSSVSISGDYTIVGAPADDVGPNTNQGSAYIFKRIGANWLEETKITASDGGVQDLFGSSVSILGDYTLVGCPLANIGGIQDQGSAYVYSRTGNSWSLDAKLTSSHGAANDYFGVSVSISEDYAIVGASNDDVGANENQGSVCFFVNND